MPVVPLPERPDAEQLRTLAKDLLRRVRAAEPRAPALVAEHAPDLPADGVTPAAAQLVPARHHGFPSRPRLRRHLADLDAAPDEGVLTAENRYRVHRGWAEAAAVARCARLATAGHPPAGSWRPVLTARHAGVHVVVFSTPDGPLFAELTPTTTTLSRPVTAAPPAVAFHTTAGTIAGVVPRGTARVAVERPGGRYAKENAILADGLFVVPNAFAVDERDVVLHVDGGGTDVAVPPRAGAWPTGPSRRATASPRPAAAWRSPWRGPTCGRSWTRPAGNPVRTPR
ncbi:hypothetical protein ACFFSW_25260 [Saccharothrix longispora]|uniref:Uncharacterized protein n=1 Tax=Saccharothrix longispora TaxID=33920 RepID=A0ABU1PZ60_9PSEU|nr:hypothetical protein [Saccharothrix longispora]MDR6595169.1 hypothetical protein [Saccharothrix longispora]